VWCFESHGRMAGIYIDIGDTNVVKEETRVDHSTGIVGYGLHWIGLVRWMV
jgi:hypothetical protein